MPLMSAPAERADHDLWLGVEVRHLAALRLTRVWWLLLAGREFLARLPAALRYRRRHGRAIRAKPGQAWFRAPEFQADG